MKRSYEPRGPQRQSVRTASTWRDLAVRYREWQRLKKLVCDLERAAAHNIEIIEHCEQEIERRIENDG